MNAKFFNKTPEQEKNLLKIQKKYKKIQKNTKIRYSGKPDDRLFVSGIYSLVNSLEKVYSN